MNNNFGIYDNSYDIMLSTFSNYSEIKKAVIFGSRAMGNYKKGSDIDVAIFGDDITYNIISDINSKLNDQLPVPYFFDVVDFNSISNDDLKKHVVEEGVVVFERG